MAESNAQGLHHVAHESITGKTNEDLFQDSHLELQERMRNPIAFHAKMMGDIMHFECYCDSDFSGLWNKEIAPVDPSTAKLRSGWIIFYAGCPVSWASKLQSQVALSTTEAEYIAMSQALRDVIPVMNLLQEMREREFQVICNEPYVDCKVFEDFSGALELARLPKLHPRNQAHKCLLIIFVSMYEKDLSRYSL